ncbi:MAG: hypothetical protein AAFO99_13780 [Bacteroidota bacterium]
MKNLSILVWVSLISFNVNAQKIIEKTLGHKDQIINVELKFASDIKVKTWDRSTVYFKADIWTEDSKYQDFYTLDIDETDTKISIVSNAKPLFKELQEEWNRNHPNKKKRYYNTGNQYEFNYVLYVPKNSNFTVSSINGSLTSEVIEGDFTADLINGDIDIKKYAGTLDLKTINGEIDLKISNTSLVAETIHGNIYADEKLSFKATNRHVGQKVEGSFNNADHTLRLNTINGNMYLRL